MLYEQRQKSRKWLLSPKVNEMLPAYGFKA